MIGTMLEDFSEGDDGSGGGGLIYSEESAKTVVESAESFLEESRKMLGT